MTGSILTVPGSVSEGIAFNSGNDGTLTIAVGPTGAKVNALVFDANGNLALGVTPSVWSGYKVIEIGGTGGNAFGTIGGASSFSSANTYYNGTNWIYKTTYNASYYLQNGGVHYWFNAPYGTAGNPITFTQAMTLDASGNLNVGQTTAGIQNVNGISLNIAANNTQLVTNHLSGTNSGASYSTYAYNGASIGGIIQSGTTAVLYNTTSDYRLKENVVPVASALATIQSLNPVNFTWKSDGRADTGFLAHEFQSVIPNSVTGAKDATDTDGNPVYQQMDNSGAIPYLVAAIKELKAEFDAYKAAHP